MKVSFDRGQPLPREDLFKTLAFAYDYALYDWDRRGIWSKGDFQPDIFYKIAIDFRRNVKGPLHRDFAGWLIDSILFCMREKNTFADMTGKVYKDNLYYGLVTVQGVDDDSATASNETSSGGINESRPGSFNASLSSENALTQPPDPDNKPLSSKREEEEISSNQKSTAATTSVSTPHRSDPENIKTDIEPQKRIGGAEVELEVMSALFCIGRQAADNARQPRYACLLPPDRTTVIVDPVKGRTNVLGRDMIESLVDVVDFLYEEFHATGEFWSFSATTVRKSTKKWVPAALWKLYLD